MTGVKITGLTINSDSITIDYSGGDGNINTEIINASIKKINV